MGPICPSLANAAVHVVSEAETAATIEVASRKLDRAVIVAAWDTLGVRYRWGLALEARCSYQVCSQARACYEMGRILLASFIG